MCQKTENRKQYVGKRYKASVVRRPLSTFYFLLSASSRVRQAWGVGGTALLLFSIVYALPASAAEALVPCTGDDPCTLRQLIELGAKVFNFLLGLGAVAAVAAIVWSGGQYILSRGDPSGMKEAKQKVTLAIIGLVILLFSVVLVNFFLTSLGLQRGVEDIEQLEGVEGIQ